MEKVKDVPTYVRGLYAQHPFFISDYYNISIEQINCGTAKLSLLTDPVKHGDHRGGILGAVLETLADMTLEVTAASVGAVASPLNISMNFINKGEAGARVSAAAHIKHHGRTTMVIELELRADNGRLLATALSTLFISNRIEAIPAQW